MLPQLDSSSRREWALLLVLSTIQFTQVMDFVIMMPLGPQFMRAFSIGPAEFGWMISAYTFAAAVSGIFAALFIDRFDRKRALLVLYAGFALGTALCAVAPTHSFFIFARIIAGVFAGILTPVIYAIIGDVIPAERRGAANGTVMSSFAVASIAGVPLGLFFANIWSWHAPFVMIVVLSIAVGFAGARLLPSMRGHLSTGKRAPFNLQDLGEFARLLESANHRWSLALIAALMIAGFTIIPYVATAMVANGGLLESHLPLAYLCGGAATLFTSRYFGKLADRKGAYPVFRVISGIAIFPIMAVAYLRPASEAWILALMTAFMVFISGRFIVGTTLIHNGVDPKRRGAFLSLMAAVQQAAAGIASLLGGLLVIAAADGRLEGMSRIGWVSVAATLLSVWIGSRILPLKKQLLGDEVASGEIPVVEPIV